MASAISIFNITIQHRGLNCNARSRRVLGLHIEAALAAPHRVKLFTLVVGAPDDARRIVLHVNGTSSFLIHSNRQSRLLGHLVQVRCAVFTVCRTVLNLDQKLVLGAR